MATWCCSACSAWCALQHTSCGACIGSVATGCKVPPMSKARPVWPDYGRSLCPACMTGLWPASINAVPTGRLIGRPRLAEARDSLWHALTLKATSPTEEPAGRSLCTLFSTVGSSSLCCECAMILASGGGATETTGNGLAQKNKSRRWSATQRGQRPDTTQRRKVTLLPVLRSGSCASSRAHLLGRLGTPRARETSPLISPDLLQFPPSQSRQLSATAIDHPGEPAAVASAHVLLQSITQRRLIAPREPQGITGKHRRADRAQPAVAARAGGCATAPPCIESQRHNPASYQR